MRAATLPYSFRPKTKTRLSPRGDGEETNQKSKESGNHERPEPLFFDRVRRLPAPLFFVFKPVPVGAFAGRAVELVFQSCSSG